MSILSETELISVIIGVLSKVIVSFGCKLSGKRSRDFLREDISSKRVPIDCMMILRPARESSDKFRRALTTSERKS